MLLLFLYFCNKAYHGTPFLLDSSFYIHKHKRERERGGRDKETERTKEEKIDIITAPLLGILSHTDVPVWGQGSGAHALMANCALQCLGHLPSSPRSYFQLGFIKSCLFTTLVEYMFSLHTQKGCQEVVINWRLYLWLFFLSIWCLKCIKVSKILCYQIERWKYWSSVFGVWDQTLNYM